MHLGMHLSPPDADRRQPGLVRKHRRRRPPSSFETEGYLSILTDNASDVRIETEDLWAPSAFIANTTFHNCHANHQPRVANTPRALYSSICGRLHPIFEEGGTEKDCDRTLGDTAKHGRPPAVRDHPVSPAVRWEQREQWCRLDCRC